MKKLLNHEDKLLKCLPEKFANFYKNAPKEFKQDYITKAGYTREEFLDLAKATKLFDYHFYAVDANDFVYKEYEYVPHTCQGWFLN